MSACWGSFGTVASTLRMLICIGVAHLVRGYVMQGVVLVIQPESPLAFDNTAEMRASQWCDLAKRYDAVVNS